MSANTTFNNNNDFNCDKIANKKKNKIPTRPQVRKKVMKNIFFLYYSFSFARITSGSFYYKNTSLSFSTKKKNTHTKAKNKKLLSQLKRIKSFYFMIKKNMKYEWVA